MPVLGNGYELGSAMTHYGSPAAGAANDPYREGQGSHSVDGKYEFQMWVYKVSDYAKVLDGSASALSVLISVSVLPTPFDADSHPNANITWIFLSLLC